MIAPVPLLIASVWYYQILHLALAPYGIFNLGRAILRRRTGAVIYLVGFSVLAIAVVNDILYAQGIIHTGLWAPAGMLALVVSLSILTTRRSRKEMAQHQRLTDDRLYTIASLWEARHPGFLHHQRNVAELSVTLGRLLRLDEQDLISLERGARIHDAGILEVPTELLLHPGKLDPEAWQRMQTHTQAITGIPADDFGGPEAAIIRHHHEHWDGNGYPDRLCGEEIPLAARIVAVADHWDALNHDRPHRQAHSKEDALEIMRRERGRSLDPKIVEVFLEHHLGDSAPRS